MHAWEENKAVLLNWQGGKENIEYLPSPTRAARLPMY